MDIFWDTNWKPKGHIFKVVAFVQNCQWKNDLTKAIA